MLPGQIAQFCVKPYPIVIHVNMLRHHVLGLRAYREFFSMNRFDLETVAPTLHRRIVLAIAFLAHAANQQARHDKSDKGVSHCGITATYPYDACRFSIGCLYPGGRERQLRLHPRCLWQSDPAGLHHGGVTCTTRYGYDAVTMNRSPQTGRCRGLFDRARKLAQ